MGTEGTVLGVVIAVVGVIGSVLVARVSAPKPAVSGVGGDLDDDRPSPAPALEVSAEIWRDMNRKMSTLEGKVDHLTRLVEEQTIRVTALEKLLRQAMRILRAAHRQLRSAGIDPEPVPPELVPYSID